MTLVAITEQQAEALKRFGVEAEVTYAIPEELFSVLHSMEPVKPKNKSHKANPEHHGPLLGYNPKDASGSSTAQHFHLWPDQLESREHTQTARALKNLLDAGHKKGILITRAEIYALTPEDARPADMVFSLRRQNVLVEAPRGRRGEGL